MTLILLLRPPSRGNLSLPTEIYLVQYTLIFFMRKPFFLILESNLINCTYVLHLRIFKWFC